MNCKQDRTQYWTFDSLKHMHNHLATGREAQKNLLRQMSDTVSFWNKLETVDVTETSPV